MESVKVNRHDLLATIERNLHTHEAVHRKATDGYRKQLVVVYRKALALVEAHKRPCNVHLTPPVSHAEDYRRVIGMLKMHVEEHISLNSNEFDSYVRDKWVWKDQFVGSTALYINKKVGR